MDFVTLAKQRCSIRSYTDQKVEPEKLEKILAAAQAAPSAKNAQPTRLLVLQSEEALGKVAKAARTYNAPLVIIALADVNEAWVRPYDQMISDDIDASIVTDHMMLAATEQGLGSVWICYFDPAVLKEEFAIPENLKPVNILAIGYPNGPVKSAERHATERKPLSETVFYDHL